MYSGEVALRLKMLSMRAIPSKQSMSYLGFVQYCPTADEAPSYLFAGISIFSCGGSCLPSTTGRSVVDVWSDQLPPMH